MGTHFYNPNILCSPDDLLFGELLVSRHLLCCAVNPVWEDSGPHNRQRLELGAGWGADRSHCRHRLGEPAGRGLVRGGAGRGSPGGGVLGSAPRPVHQPQDPPERTERDASRGAEGAAEAKGGGRRREQWEAVVVNTPDGVRPGRGRYIDADLIKKN